MRLGTVTIRAGLASVPISACVGARADSEQARVRAAVDGDRRAGDERRRLRAQERRDPPEVLGIAEHARGDPASRAIELAAVELADPVGVVEAGLERVHGDAVGRRPRGPAS